MEETLWTLGALNKSEVLEVKYWNVPGVLCPSDFEFLRTVNFSPRVLSVNNDITPTGERKAFCLRLKEMRVDESFF